MEKKLFDIFNIFHVWWINIYWVDKLFCWKFLNFGEQSNILQCKFSLIDNWNKLCNALLVLIHAYKFNTFKSVTLINLVVKFKWQVLKWYKKSFISSSGKYWNDIRNENWRNFIAVTAKIWHNNLSFSMGNLNDIYNCILKLIWHNKQQI